MRRRKPGATSGVATAVPCCLSVRLQANGRDLDLERSKWSGEGEFTEMLIDMLRGLSGINLVRVEDAPASRSEADYNFISNELFVTFATQTRRERIRRFGFLPASRT